MAGPCSLHWLEMLRWWKDLCKASVLFPCSVPSWRAWRDVSLGHASVFPESHLSPCERKHTNLQVTEKKLLSTDLFNSQVKTRGRRI